MFRITTFVQKIICEHLKNNSIAIDATCGNGNDTLFLTSLIDRGKIYAFDIQEIAIERTKNKIKADNVTLILDSHENIKKYVRATDLIIYNLGYLPNHDKKITTNYQSTLKSIAAGLDILKIGGLILVVVYTGHQEGKLKVSTFQGILKHCRIIML